MPDGTDQKGQISGPLGLDGSRTILVRPLQKAELTVSRVHCPVANHGMTSPFPRDDAYLVIVQLGHACAKQLWLGGRALPPGYCPEGTFSALNLQLEPTAYLKSAFDTVQIYLPQTVLNEIADDCAANNVGPLACPPGFCIADPVVGQLGASLLPALNQPDQANKLFVEYVVLALSTHLASKYGGMRDPAALCGGGLAPLQQRRATEFMITHLSQDISLAQVAKECGLSLSHFSRAFKRSTGMPPHRWLRERRIEHAKDMIVHSSLSLTEIALACGFSDLSHLSRVFAQRVGMAPRAWRHQLLR